MQITGRGREPRPNSLSFYAPNFYTHETMNPWFYGERIPAGAFVTNPLPAVERRLDPDPSLFDAVHAEILTGIKEGRFKKVVPYVSEEWQFESELSWSMFPNALAPQENQYSYGLQASGEGMCGITPELLFQVEGDVCTTMALAGTAPVDGPSLLDDPKERLEHELVIGHIQQSLKGLGEITVGETREQAYGSLKHLLTPIQVKLEYPPSFMDLVARLHPTAALAGWPRASALDFLRLRGPERIRFGAPFGFVDGDSMMCIVAIRCLQWRGRTAWIMSGCGVVEGSHAEKEWVELNLKRRSVARQLGLEE